MKKTFKIALIFILALSSLKANAVVFHSNEVKTIIANKVLEMDKNYTDAELKVEVVGLAFKDLSLPDGKVSFIVKPSADKFMARDLERVSVYVDGKFVRMFTASVVVKAYQNVLVASTIIEREKEINLSDTRVEKKEVSNCYGYQVKPDDINKGILAKKFFSEGEIIDKRFIKIKPEILRNSNVTVFFNTNNLTVSVEGTALSDGSKGDNICVMNKEYNKIYKGTVIGENRVLVKL